MKKVYLLIFSIIVLLFISCNSSEKVDEEELKAEMENYATEYMVSLKTVLVENMKAGGPQLAINVCADTAMTLAKNYSESRNVQVKRFSFKNRNASNVPDVFEEKALKYFEKLLAEGKLNSETFILEQEKLGSSKFAKYVRPIFVDSPCLNCHGSESQILEEVKLVLNEKYPNDKATGFKIGDLRGAISVTKEL
ncbi:MAG: DUF3365 domain-containing protein [Ignavibacteriae bacterium]|nr:DUF3365 domain-containing protein [Ignavibacteriota bacterium]MCB9207750.1 DUF3365 domain-containing protein [Ignavibacteriales bacterium]MCB9258520.1 DUF3365 domain-containing protein [Ignavibacteriales bacterium]